MKSSAAAVAREPRIAIGSRLAGPIKISVIFAWTLRIERIAAVDTVASVARSFQLPWSDPLSSQSLRRGGSLRKAGGGVGFHVTVYVANPRLAHLATEAMLDRTLITMSSDIGDVAGPVTGFVQSIEEDANAVPRCWRITILEAEDQHATPVVSFVRR
jgi:hypothetical protein